MEVPYFTKNAMRLLFITAEHQDEEEPLSMSKLAEAADTDLVVIQRGRDFLLRESLYLELFEEEKAGGSGGVVHITLTEQGEEVFQKLDAIRDVISDADQS